MIAGRKRNSCISAFDELAGIIESESYMKTVATFPLAPSGRNQHRAHTELPRVAPTLLALAFAAGLCEVVNAQQIQFRPGVLLQAAGQARLFTGRETSPRELLSRLAPRLRALFSSVEEFLP